MRHTRALLIDLDGVIRRWVDNDSQLAATFSVSGSVVRQIAFEAPLLQEVITGRITDEAWRTQIAERLTAKGISTRAAELVSHWSAPIGEVVASVLDLVRMARSSAKVVLVTNATSRLESDLQRLNLIDEFDVIINSSDVGYAKPDAQIFEAALKAVNLSPQAAAFVDDSATNVRAAAALGIDAHHFTGAEALHKFLVGWHQKQDS